MLEKIIADFQEAIRPLRVKPEGDIPVSEVLLAEIRERKIKEVSFFAEQARIDARQFRDEELRHIEGLPDEVRRKKRQFEEEMSRVYRVIEFSAKQKIRELRYD